MHIQRHSAPVLVVGSGPAGLIAALQLARHGTRCILVERNHNTTKWPKMDITNCRSMELFKRLDIADGLRQQGVPQDYSFDVLFSSGLSDAGNMLHKWDLPSPNDWRERIRKQNDGSLPREPYQRCSQAVFEAWLKPLIEKEPLIDSYFGLKFESLVESGDGVESTLIDTITGETHAVKSDYVIGCDGAGSRVRRAIGGELIGGPVPAARLLVHFKSRDLALLHKQGQFWHIFFLSGGAIISQDEKDTWTCHLPIALDADWKSIDPEDAIAQVLGGVHGPCKIKVDQILVTSVWRPNIAIADRYVSAKGRVFLSGDAAHQNIPTGGYGMNTAIGDSFDIGWKLSAVTQGWGGKYLLQSYDIERYPVAMRNIERSGVHGSVHATYATWVLNSNEEKATLSHDDSELQESIIQLVASRDGENKDHGIDMGYRYNGSAVIIPDTAVAEPAWNYRTYVPSTWPGARAPHVYLNDGETSIHDLFGREYTLVDFTKDGVVAQAFSHVAAELKVPLNTVHLPDESHVAKIYERDAVLVRPDDHVAWRAPLDGFQVEDVARILRIAVGKESVLSDEEIDTQRSIMVAGVKENEFTLTVGHVREGEVDGLAEFQK